MMNTTTLSILAVLLAVVLGLAARPADAQILVPDAVAQALETGPAVQGAKQRLEAIRHDVKIVSSFPEPVVGLSAMSEVMYPDTWVLTYSYHQPIPLKGVLRSARSVAERDVEVAERSVEVLRAELLLEARSAFALWQRAISQSRTIEQIDSILEQAADTATRTDAESSTTSSGADAISIAADRASLHARTADLDAMVAHATGVIAAISTVPFDQLTTPRAADTAPTSSQTQQDNLGGQQFERLVREAEKARAIAATKLARDKSAPVPAVGLTVVQRPQGVSPLALVFGVSVPMSFFAFDRNQARVSGAEARKAVAEKRLEEFYVWSAAKLAETHRTMAAYQKGASASLTAGKAHEDAAISLLARYAAGKGDLEPVLVHLREALSSRLQALERVAVIHALEARIDWLRGMSIEEQVAKWRTQEQMEPPGP